MSLRKAVELSQQELSDLLYRDCSLALRPCGRRYADTSDCYVAWFTRGVLKVGVSACIEQRMSSLPSDAQARGIVSSTDEHPDLCAVVPNAGLGLEKSLIQALSLERLSGEYFSGPLSARIAALLLERKARRV